MKLKLKIIVTLNLLLLIASCQKNKFELNKKQDVLVILKEIELKSLKPNEEEKILDSINQKLESQENDSITRNLYFKIAVKYYNINSFDKYLNITRKVQNLSIKSKDSFHQAKSLYYLGDYYEEKNQLDSAFSYYTKSQKLYKFLKDNSNTGKITLYKAGILFDAGNFTESEIEAINALKYLLKTNDIRSVYECYNLLAITLKELNNFKKSLEYFDLALLQLNKLEKENYPNEKVVKSRIACFNNIGRVYEKMKNYHKAIYFYSKGLKTKNLKQDYIKSYAMLLDNIAYSTMKTGNYKDVNKLLFESLRLSDSLNILSIIVSSDINIGEYYIHEKDTIKALNYLKKGLLLSKKIESNPYTIKALKLLIENDLNNKTYYTHLYFKISDSLQNLERVTRDKFARIAFETEEIEEKNQLLIKRNTIIISISVSFIILFGIFFTIYRLRTKNKELLSIQEQQVANEKIYQLMLQQQSETEKARNEERNRIAMELHDGIVNSIFTTRFNLLQLDLNSTEKKKELVEELEKTENEVRRVSHDLTQNLLFEDKNLPEILSNLVESQKNQYNTKFDLSIDKYIDWSTVTSANKIHIYRIIQEAIQNSNKYSKAERCFIILLKTANKITIRIWDNGIGFNAKKVKYGIGLKNIKERTTALNGELKITSRKSNGTTIEIIF